jgi:mannose-6-phosphate isomerase-like protein (cupin superfamily)
MSGQRAGIYRRLDMGYIVVNRDQLVRDGNSFEFEGYLFGDAGVSIILVDVPPGGGPRLHSHPYEEVFIVQEGRATYTVGSEVVEVAAGQIVVAPAGVAHKFVNSGDGPLRQVDIHASGKFITEWLED